jgi:hypothetical protein
LLDRLRTAFSGLYDVFRSRRAFEEKNKIYVLYVDGEGTIWDLEGELTPEDFVMVHEFERVFRRYKTYRRPSGERVVVVVEGNYRTKDLEHAYYEQLKGMLPSLNLSADHRSPSEEEVKEGKTEDDFSIEAYRVLNAKIDSMFKPMNPTFLYIIALGCLGLGAFIGILIGVIL